MVFVLCRVVGSQLAPQIADLAPSSDHEACRNLVCTASKAVGVTCTDPTKTNIFMENGEPAVLGSVVQGTMLYFGFNGELTTRRRRSLPRRRVFCRRPRMCATEGRTPARESQWVSV